MQMLRLDHVNVRTSNLDAMIDWYDRILGLKVGKRPDFDFPGAWMYLGAFPVLHLVGVARPCAAVEPRIEHFALAARGMADLRRVLDDNGIAYTIDPVPGMELVQVNLRDCDGNHIHIDFDSAESD